ncbi:MAG: pyridoxal-phosphate dependent enzyme [Bacteroidetes bacterium]|nr:pyridoxal-phosphate dependent enzyme [Bacteroidota bacterium]
MIPNKETITQAAERILPYIHRTPLITSKRINKIFNADIYFKCENLQKAGAFKTRGAINAVFSLNEHEFKNGVATHSSGNHAQALARAASIRRIKAYIVMPEDSSKVKIEAVKSYGGIITFCKPTLEARETTLALILEKTKAIEIHPYDNYKIIAGQATAAKEFFEQIPEIKTIIVPVGGGGLLSGTALAAHYFSSDTRVIAVEPEQANDAFKSFYSGSFVPSLNPDTIADGLRTSLGTKTFPIIQKHVHQIVTVSEKSIIEAMRLVWESTKMIIEASSAVPIAALLEKKFNFEGQKIGIVISGGNVDFDNLPW